MTGKRHGSRLEGSSGEPPRSAIAPADKSESIKRTGLRFGTWGVNINFENGTFELYRANRPELAHLTVLGKTRSGEIDIHLTYGHEAAMSGAEPKRYEPLLRFRPEQLEPVGVRLSETMERVLRTHLLSHYKRFRPGWLARKGYVVSVVERRVVLDWLKRIAPHRKRKFRFDPATAFSPAAIPMEFAEEMYEASVLHVLVEEGVRVGFMDDAELGVQAIRVRGGGAGDVGDNIVLSHTLGPDGTVGWWGMKGRDAGRLQRKILEEVFDWIVSVVRPEHGDTFEKLVRGLGLDEGDDGSRFVENVRAFLRSPRNPVRQPYPGMGVR